MPWEKTSFEHLLLFAFARQRWEPKPSSPRVLSETMLSGVENLVQSYGMRVGSPRNFNAHCEDPGFTVLVEGTTVFSEHPLSMCWFMYFSGTVAEQIGLRTKCVLSSA